MEIDIVKLVREVHFMVDKFDDLIGKRIRLISTSDPYTKRKYGDTGTVTEVIQVGEAFTQLWIRWDDTNDLGLALVPETGDQWEIIE